MRGRPRRTALSLSREEREELKEISLSPASERRAVQRATTPLMSDEGMSGVAIGEELSISRPAILNTLKKYRNFGLHAALRDLARSGRPKRRGEGERAWILSLACHAPQDYEDGPKARSWSMEALANYARGHCAAEGYPNLSSISSSEVWRTINKKRIESEK